MHSKLLLASTFGAAAAFDADDLVKVGGCRPWESRTVPKKRTTKDEHGEPVRKKLRDEGKKPATCPCGNTFFSSAKLSSKRPGIPCRRCGGNSAKYD